MQGKTSELAVNNFFDHFMTGVSKLFCPRAT